MYSGFLRNVWYVGLPSAELAVGKMKSLKILNEPIVFYRDSKGKASACVISVLIVAFR